MDSAARHDSRPAGGSPHAWLVDHLAMFEDDRAATAPPRLYWSKLAHLMEEQVSVLRRMDERQSAGDLSKEPMPEVPATSSSAWNALLRSALTDTIQPKVDRWRNGLDALLVFLGLFSAIVTSFFVQSLTALKQDEAARTNELLANLTDIILAISGVPLESLNTPQPVVFQPDRTDVRLNSLWSLSLILSLSIAALAVACRGFVNMVCYSRFTKASEKLVDIRMRWRSSERFLGPAIELLPQILVIPVLLFIAGLLDTLFSSVMRLSRPPLPILFTSGICLLLISAVSFLLCYSVVNRGWNPSGSPKPGVGDRGWQKRGMKDRPETLSEKAPTIYHEVVQATHDDDTLNQASAALYSIIQSLETWPRYAGNQGLRDEERATFLHLLSPEASFRSNRTAVQVITRIQESSRISYSSTDMSALVPAILQAMKHAPAILTVNLWDSPFVHAMAIVANAGSVAQRYPPLLAFLNSEYLDSKNFPYPSAEYTVRTTVISAAVEILFTKLVTSLEETHSGSENDIVAGILSPLSLASSIPGTPKSTVVSALNTINPGKIVAALLYLPIPQNVPVLTLILRWLVRETSSWAVLHAVQTHIADVTVYDSWPSILFFTTSITGQVCLAEPEFKDHKALAELCIAALLKIAQFHQFHPQLPALVHTAVAALREIGDDRIGELRQELGVVRKFVEDGTWRWNANQRMAVVEELMSLHEDGAAKGSEAGNGELQEELVQFLKPEGESSTASRASSATVAM
ncbi:hypothetical protein C8J57DRAFT_1410116 [Mycena rebaudengoi]|nr:hypothetical protein C8J57DRAFT_1410116 [Mycena rebaudengoi]